MKKILVLILFAVLYSSVFATTYYVAPAGGSDSNPGTISSPWATWAKAFTTARAGDIVYFRGGVYYTTDRISIAAGYNGNSGTASSYISYFAYPGEVPILDCINKTVHGEALFLTSINYVHLKGLTIRNNKESTNDDLDASGFAFQYNIGLIVENCTSYGNGCRGFYFAEVASANILNCDSYNNISEKSTGSFLGNHGEGLIFTGTTTGQPFNGNVTVTGCRAWGNSDSGFGSNCGGVETWINNWSFDNGRLAGEGCGFKYLPAAWLGTGVLSRIFYNNIAAHNGYGTSNHEDNAGFTENGAEFDLPNVKFDNNFSYGNYSEGYSTYGGLNGARAVRLMRNNVSYKDPVSHVWYSGNPPADTYNSWNNSNMTLRDADFQSVDYTQLSRPRKADGSLPDITFGKLATVSCLIDAGTNVGLPFNGTTADLGCSEASTGSTITIPVYQSSAIENTTPAVVDMTYNTSLANITPPTSAFTVMVNSVGRAVSSVAVSGTKVSLTLSSAVVSGNIVTVAYTIPGSNPLQTTSGGQAASITGQSVTNKVTSAPPVSIPVYVTSSVENTTPSILTMTYSLSLANVVPASSAFTVKVNSVARAISAVSISGTHVTISLSSPIVYGDVISLAYTKPATNPLQTTSGGAAATFSALAVSNNLAQPVTEPAKVTVTMTTYPSHVRSSLNVTLAYSSVPTSTISPEILRISNLYGKLYLEKSLTTGVTNIQIPINLPSGVYNVSIIGYGQQLASKKIRVYKEATYINYLP